MTIEDIERLDIMSDKLVTRYNKKSNGKKSLFYLILLDEILGELKEIKSMLKKDEVIIEEIKEEAKPDEEKKTVASKAKITK